VTDLSRPGHLGAEVAERLRAAGCLAAEEEAEELLAASTGDANLEALVARREQGEPLAWITGTARFCGHQVLVDQGVYVPRPQSEELAHRAAARLSGDGGWAVDLCTGSGAVAVHLNASSPEANVVGVDVDRRAAACARRNGVTAAVGDLGDPLPTGRFDLVTGVAPYVPTADLRFLPSDVRLYEPRHALDGGEDGLDLVRRLIASAARLLRPGGWLVIEIGGDQDRRLAPALASCGFDDAHSWFDVEGDLRGVEAQLSARCQGERTPLVPG